MWHRSRAGGSTPRAHALPRTVQRVDQPGNHHPGGVDGDRAAHTRSMHPCTAAMAVTAGTDPPQSLATNRGRTAPQRGGRGSLLLWGRSVRPAERDPVTLPGLTRLLGEGLLQIGPGQFEELRIPRRRLAV